MFNTAILDVVIGLVFVYLLLSLMCSAANEMMEGWLKNRAADLERGLRELLKDPKGDGLVKKVYDHPLISGLFEGGYNPADVGKLKRFFGQLNLPSYIPTRTFALVLLDTALPAKDNQSGGTATATPSGLTTDDESRDAFEKLRSSISSIGNADVAKALLALVDAADNDVAKARENIEKWFDASMDRVSGWYKRRSQVFVFVIGLFVTVGVNADSVLIAKRLSADKVLRESLVSAAQDYAKVSASQPSANATTNSNSSSTSASGTTTSIDEEEKKACLNPDSPECKYRKSLKELKSLSLPIGWESGVDGQKWPGLRFWGGPFWTGWAQAFREHIFGWLLTGLAISLGAPFWFDTLNKFIVVRATVKPTEKSPEEPPKG